MEHRSSKLWGGIICFAVANYGRQTLRNLLETELSINRRSDYGVSQITKIQASKLTAKNFNSVHLTIMIMVILYLFTIVIHIFYISYIQTPSIPWIGNF